MTEDVWKQVKEDGSHLQISFHVTTEEEKLKEQPRFQVILPL